MKLINWAWLLAVILSFPSWAKSPYAHSPLDREVIHKKYYSLSYNEDHEQANWVAYELNRNHLQNCTKRTNSFRTDPDISTGSATLADYKGSGFDRGHLVPAGDMKISKEAMRDTFVMSNMSPQPPRYNQGKWAQLENLARAFAGKYEQTWIVTGPVLRDNLRTIGVDNQVSLPQEYFKVILRKTNNKYEGIAFLMPITLPYNELTLYALDIESVENITGIDFFHFLPDHIEKEVERNYNESEWDFKAKFNYLPCSSSAI